MAGNDRGTGVAYGGDMLNDYRRNIGVSAVLAGLIVVVINYIQGDVVFATILLVLLGLLLGLLLWWTRPSRGGPHISHAAHRQQPATVT